MAITVVTPASGDAQTNPVSRNLTRPLHDKRLHRWSLVVGADNDTFDTKLPNIVEVAITGTRLNDGPTAPMVHASGDCSITGVSAAGVVTFSVAGSTLLDLLVWTSGN